MANYLKQYLEKREELCSQIESDSLPPTSLIDYQEISYRIGVLETFKAFMKTAPVTLDRKVMGQHYQIMDANVRALLSERQLGPKTDEEGQKKRETALTALTNVVNDVRKRFGSFNATAQDQYKKSIGNLINTVMPVWIQFRNTYVNL